MYEYIKTWLEMKTDRRAVTALEYGLIAALVGVAIAAAVGTLGVNLTATFTNVSNKLTGAAAAR